MSTMFRLTSAAFSQIGRLRALLSDRRGVAAIEFAFVAPVLLCMYFITMEASQGIEVNKKVSRIGSAVADLITQQTSISKAEVVAILRIGEAIIQPYNRSKPNIEVTAITFDTAPTPVATVTWSLKLDKNGNPAKVLDKGKVVTDSQLDRIRAPGAFYVRVRSWMEYKPVITWSAEAASVGLLSAFNDIDMSETYYLAPRNTAQSIPCGDCP